MMIRKRGKIKVKGKLIMEKKVKGKGDKEWTQHYFEGWQVRNSVVSLYRCYLGKFRSVLRSFYLSHIFPNSSKHLVSQKTGREPNFKKHAINY